jgi:hypothetical protein
VVERDHRLLVAKFEPYNNRFCQDVKRLLCTIHAAFSRSYSVRTTKLILERSSRRTMFDFSVDSPPPGGATAPRRSGPPHYRGFMITLRHTTLGMTPLDGWSARRRNNRLIPTSTRHSQQTNIHSPRGIRTHNPSKRVAVDTRLRPCGHWDRHLFIYLFILPRCNSPSGQMPPYCRGFMITHC